MKIQLACIAAIIAAVALPAYAQTIVPINAAFLAASPPPYVLGMDANHNDLTNTTYQLQANVTTPGIAFIVGGIGTTLDLNGYTLTYDNAAPPIVTNPNFSTAAGWNLSGAPSAAIAPNTYYLPRGANVLALANITGTQIVLSSPITLPASGRDYAATISVASVNQTSTITLDVLAADKATVLATDNTTGNWKSPVAAFSFPANGAGPVYLRITVAAPTADTVALTCASLDYAGDYGIFCTGDWTSGVPSQIGQQSPRWTTYQPAMTYHTTGISVIDSSAGHTGAIVQGQGHGYGSGPAYAKTLNGVTIANVHATYGGIDSTGFLVGYSGTGLTITGCTLTSLVDKVSNRRDGIVSQINCDNGTVVQGPIVISGNVLTGSPQVGILVHSATGVTLTGNTVKSNSIVGDGYGINCDHVANFTIANNAITASPSSRGIILDGYDSPSSNGTLSGNTVLAQERPNPEYGLNFCTAAYFQRAFDDAATDGWSNIAVSGNTFAAQTSQGMCYGAAGMRVTLPSNNANAALGNTISNNTFSAVLQQTAGVNPDSNHYAWGVLLEGIGANCCPAFTGNTIATNNIAVQLGSGDGRDVASGTFVGAVFQTSPVASNRTYTAIGAGYGDGELENVTFTGNTFSAPASLSISWPATSPPWDGSLRTLNFGGLATLTVKGANGTQTATIPLPSTTYTQAANMAVTSQSLGPYTITTQVSE
jgi:parallel beta-helix repeat protein